MIELTKPTRLRPGDRIVIVAPSWGGPATFPLRYESGKRQLTDTFDLQVVDMPHALSPADYIAQNPKARADDLMAAFSDSTINGIIAAVGGDDCIRLLPYLDLDVIRKNPKVFLGFSDTTALHLACFQAGLSTFYGPTIMAGFAESGGMHRYTIEGLRKAIFTPAPIGLIPTNTEGWTATFEDWLGDAPPRVLNASGPPLLLQGEGAATGHLLGGCAEVLEMSKGTAWWPTHDQWRNAILFYETSEDAPSPQSIRYWLRNFAAQGILHVLSGIVLGRPDPKDKLNYQEDIEAIFVEALAEAGLSQLPLLSRIDFGHTQPMVTLPYGARCQIDCQAATLKILDAGVI